MTDQPSPAVPPPGILTEAVRAGAAASENATKIGAKSPRFAIACFSAVAAFAIWLAYSYFYARSADGSAVTPTGWMRAQQEKIDQLSKDRDSHNARLAAMERERDITGRSLDNIILRIDRLLENRK